jgi:predicted SprT family Zn-dependent metalloprotease
MEGKLAASTTRTGGVKLVWSTRLRTAAGRAHWTRANSRPLSEMEDQHNLKIELSAKIITSEGNSAKTNGDFLEKLRDTLAHELCHCALWVIDKDPHSHHGKQFKLWSDIVGMFLIIGDPKSPKIFLIS